MSSAQQYNPGLAELGRKNQAGGYVGIDENGDVVGTFAQRVGTSAEIAAIVLANGELAYTSDTQELFIGDGATTGGLFYYQKPQTQRRTWSDGLPLPNFASIDPETTIVFPKKLGATYRLSFDADFTLDSGNLSNFSVRVFCNGALDASYTGTTPSIISTDWFDLSTGLLLERIS